MVDLAGQYNKIKNEIDAVVLECIASAEFINGPAVSSFGENLCRYLGSNHVIPCANGTDALQIALMALGLERGDEVIVPAFTYVATAEVIALLGLTPVMVDVSLDSFNITPEHIENAITPRTRAVVPVHLFGQSCEMEPIMEVAHKHGLFVIEDNAQAIGSETEFEGRIRKTGTVGHIGCTSFFPSKNLGCFGDGGAMFTDDDEIAVRLRMIANHGQAKKYYHSVVGVNSRLDTIQAGILNVKLNYLDEYSEARQRTAAYYDDAFDDVEGIKIPIRETRSTHVYHQYTLQVPETLRDDLQNHLKEKGIPSMIYYPLPLYRQEAFRHFSSDGFELSATEELCKRVLSLPIHTEMSCPTQDYIIDAVRSFFKSHGQI